MPTDRVAEAGVARAGGIELAWRLDGPAGAEVLLLGHALMADMAQWDDNLAALAARWRVLRYDTRGHGDSPVVPGPADLGALAGDAVALLDRLGIERAHYLGVSLGALVGQQLGIEHGDRLLSLVLCDAGATMPAAARQAWDDRIAAAAHDYDAVREGTLQRWFTPAFAAREPARHARVREMLRRTPLAGYLACAAAVRDAEFADRLGAIRAPTLVVHGVADPAWSVAQAEALAGGIAGARLALVSDAAHVPNIEQPAAFNRLVVDFLAGPTS